PSLGIVANVAVALLVGSAANFATLVPSAPGYVGTFEAALITVLRNTAGVENELAIAYAFVVHATLFLPVVVVGTLVLWRSHMTIDQITHAPDRATATPPEAIGRPPGDAAGKWEHASTSRWPPSQARLLQ